jgi:hypothetical protein
MLEFEARFTAIKEFENNVDFNTYDNAVYCLPLFDLWLLITAFFNVLKLGRLYDE